MATSASPYREAADATTSSGMAPVPRAVSSAEARAWRILGWGPPALGAYVAVASISGCRPLGHASPTVTLIGLLWGVAAFGVSFGVRAWANRGWPSEAFVTGRLDDAEVQLRRICAFTRFVPAHHAACLGGLALVAMRRGDLASALRIQDSALANGWLQGGSRASVLYTRGTLHALRGEVEAGRRAVAEADALAPKRLVVWSSVIGGHLAIAEGAFEQGAAKLEAAWAQIEDLQPVGSRKIVQALWGYCLHRCGAPEDQVQAHLVVAAPVARRQVNHYLQAWPELDAFLAERAVIVDA